MESNDRVEGEKGAENGGREEYQPWRHKARPLHRSRVFLSFFRYVLDIHGWVKKVLAVGLSKSDGSPSNQESRVAG
jgi:hypothetical protein